MSSTARIAAWLMRLPGDVRSIQLVLLQLGGEDLIQEWQPPFSDPGELARELCELAQEDCNERDEACRYAVRGVRIEGAPVQTVTKCRVAGKPGYQAPGDTQSVVGQTLRHTEAMARIYVQAQSTAFATLQEANAKLRVENSELRAMLQAVFTHLQGKLTGEDEDELKSSAILEKAWGWAETHLLPAVADAAAERMVGDPAARPAQPGEVKEH